MRLVWEEEKEDRIDIVERLHGDGSEDEWHGGFGRTGVPRKIWKEIPRLTICGETACTDSVDMEVGVVGINIRDSIDVAKTTDGPRSLNRKKQFRNIRTMGGRRRCSAEWPISEKRRDQHWGSMGGSWSRKAYRGQIMKMMANIQSRGRLAQAEISESANATR